MRASEPIVVLVGMGIDAPTRDDDLKDLAGAVGVRLAYLQGGDPTLLEMLDELAAATPGASVRLVAAPTAGSASPARSWLRRVAADWIRHHQDQLAITIGEKPVTGREAPINSPAFERVPSHGRHVLICRGPRCTARNAARTAEAFSAAVRSHNLGDDKVLITQTGCLYPCNHAPVVVVASDDQWLGPVSPDAARGLVASWSADSRPEVDRTITPPR